MKFKRTFNVNNLIHIYFDFQVYRRNCLDWYWSLRDLPSGESYTVYEKWLDVS